MRTAMSEARMVTETDAIMSGRVPKRATSLVGYQLVPKMKSVTLTSLKIGIPSLKRKSMMSSRIIKQVSPTIKKNFSRR